MSNGLIQSIGKSTKYTNAFFTVKRTKYRYVVADRLGRYNLVLTSQNLHRRLFWLQNVRNLHRHFLAAMNLYRRLFLSAEISQISIGAKF